MDLTKEEAIKIVISCAKEYFNNLCYKDFLFIVGKPEAPECLGITFRPNNFMHLTGLETPGNKISSADFFNACMTNRLSPGHIAISKDGTTEMKLKVLPELMHIHKNARMIGDFSQTGVKLYTEKLVGNVYACMGFVLSGSRYVPNTALNYDIRDISKNRKRILAIFGKPGFGDIYRELCYLAKGIHLEDINADIQYVFDIPAEKP